MERAAKGKHTSGPFVLGGKPSSIMGVQCGLIGHCRVNYIHHGFLWLNLAIDLKVLSLDFDVSILYGQPNNSSVSFSLSM